MTDYVERAVTIAAWGQTLGFSPSIVHAANDVLGINVHSSKHYSSQLFTPFVPDQASVILSLFLMSGLFVTTSFSYPSRVSFSSHQKA